MDDRNAQVGWSEAQWNRVREEVLRAWQRVRVAGSFLPVYDALPRATQVVPSEVLVPRGTVDERSVAPLVEISLLVRLSRQQVLEEDLSGALLQFRRRATQLAQLEDWHIFNGTFPYDKVPDFDVWIGPGSYRPDFEFLNAFDPADQTVRGAPDPLTAPMVQVRGLLARNPGALGLMGGARRVNRELKPVHPGGYELLSINFEDELVQQRGSLANGGLITTVTSAMSTLENSGYVSPFACVLGRRPFDAAHVLVDASATFLRDRLEPLIGRKLMHSSAIDTPPAPFPGYHPPKPEDWQRRGVLISLAGDAVDLVLAAQATPEFRQVDEQGRYVFAVFERFALRIKDPNAIVPLQLTD
jgi:uncharacterized linocin/CFP29 family protein